MSVQIAEVGLSDVGAFARFWVGPSGSADDVNAKARKIESLMRRSQNLDPAMPLGWVARTPEQGIVAGKLCFAWSVTNGSATQKLAMSGFLRVEPEFAAMAGLLFKKYLALSSRYALVASSTNAASARLWKAFKGVPLAGSDTQWIRLGTSTAAKREAMRLRTGRARVSELLGPFVPARRVTAAPLREIDFISYESGPGWRGARDSAFLAWRVNPAVKQFGDSAGSGFVVLVGQGDHGPAMTVARVLDWSLRGPLDSVDGLFRTLPVDAISFDFVLPSEAGAFEEVGFLRYPREAPFGWVIDPGGFLGGEPLLLRGLDSDTFV